MTYAPTNIRQFASTHETSVEAAVSAPPLTHIGATKMTIRYFIDIIDGAKFVEQEDRSRAEAAIDAALDREGITTTEQLEAALLASVARSECEPHDAALADAYERIVSAGDVALTEGWLKPNGAGLSIGVR